MSYDFANILFSGRCNLRCPYCIGSHDTLQQMPDNLQLFPLRELDRFIDLLQEYGIRQLSLTGTNTDPQLYAHESELIAYLREHIPGIRLSLHTNAQLALKKLETFNLYDRATLSVPSLQPDTYRALTGGGQVLDLRAITQVARIPLKISTILTPQNVHEIPAMIDHCRRLRISRLVLRKPYGDTRDWQLSPNSAPVRYFGNNPVYDMHGVEVTIWDFSAATVRCLNLFSDGTISPDYRIVQQDR